MNISSIADPTLVNSNYRAYQPIQVLSRHGHRVHVNLEGQPRIDMAQLSRSDVALIHRYTDPQLRQAVEQLRKRGVGIVWDNDDDLAAVPRSNPNYRAYGGPMRRQVIAATAAMVRLADVVTTPSPVLARQFEAMGAVDVRVLENYLPPEFSKVRSGKHQEVTLAWLAGLEHQLDYQQLRLRETLLRLLDRHDGLRIMSIGLGLGLPSDRYEHIRLVDFTDLARVLAACDVGIAPLADITLNQARSNIKLKEYGAAGIAWLASPVGPYAQLGPAEGGRLVSDDRWFEEIDRLVVEKRERRKLAKSAQKWARSQAIDRHAHLWVSAFEAAIERGRSRAAHATREAG